MAPIIPAHIIAGYQDSTSAYIYLTPVDPLSPSPYERAAPFVKVLELGLESTPEVPDQSAVSQQTLRADVPQSALPHYDSAPVSTCDVAMATLRLAVTVGIVCCLLYVLVASAMHLFSPSTSCRRHGYDEKDCGLQSPILITVVDVDDGHGTPRTISLDD